MRQENGLGGVLAFIRAGDAGMIKVDMDHGFAALLARYFAIDQPDQERAALLHGVYVTGVPACLVEEEVFVTVEPKQHHGVEATVIVTTKQNGIFALEIVQLARKNDAFVDGIAKSRRVADGDAKVGMGEGIEKHRVGHGSV
jgi:hypothetical protein